MDADSPDLKFYQQAAKKYGAYLLIDCAHDFGHLGPTGKGTLLFTQVPGKLKDSVIFPMLSCVELEVRLSAPTLVLWDQKTKSLSS